MNRSAAASDALRRRLADRGGPRHDPDLVEAPLSYIQESIWLLDRFSNGKDASVHRPCVLTVPAARSRDQVARALSALVERHHGLRSTYPIVGGSPRQRLQPPFVPEVREIPARSDERWEHTVTARVAGLADRVPPLGDRPPLAAGVELIAGPGDRNALVLPFHHVMFDGLSEALLCTELTEALRAVAQGRALATDPPSLQPADWAVWQRADRTPDSLQQSLDWWVERLEGVENHWIGQPPGGSKGFVEHAVQMDRDAVQRLVDRGSSDDASLFAVLLHGLSRSVQELTGDRDVAVGVPVSGRTSSSLEQVIGCLSTC